MILLILGYIPGYFMAIGLYEVAETQIQMPFAMTLLSAGGVFCETVLMCCLSAFIAIRKAWSADPAEVFCCKPVSRLGTYHSHSDSVSRPSRFCLMCVLNSHPAKAKLCYSRDRARLGRRHY